MSAGSRRRVPAAVLVAGPGLLTLALCLIGITGRSLGFDEGATVSIVSQHGGRLWHAIARDGGNMSGYYLMLHVLIGAFGDGPWVLRLPSAVFAACTPPCVVGIGLTLWRDGHGSERGRARAGIAGLLCAVSLPLVYWGQTARGYAGMLCFACVAMLCFVRLTEASTAGRPWSRWAVGYVVAMTLATYCGFIVVVIVAVQLVALLPRRATLVRFAAGCVVPLAILCLPIAMLAVRRGSGQLFWVPRPSGQVDTQVLQSLTGAGLQSTFHRVATTTPGWILTALVVLALLAGAVRAAVAAHRAGDDLAGNGVAWPTGLVLTWALLPPVVMFLVSLVAPQPVFLSRNLLIAVPGVALAVAFALTDRRVGRRVAVAGLGIALIVRVVPVLAAVDVSPEPWAAVTAQVLAEARPGDCIAFYPEDARNPFRWYAARAGALDRAPRSVLPDAPWSSDRSYVELYPTLTPARVATLARSCRRMWLVASHEGQASGPAVSVRHRVRWERLTARLERAFGVGTVTSEGWASTIHVELMGGRARP